MNFVFAKSDQSQTKEDHKLKRFGPVSPQAAGTKIDRENETQNEEERNDKNERERTTEKERERQE